LLPILVLPAIRFCKIVLEIRKNKKGRADIRSAFFTYGSLNAVILVRGHSPF
jgi:hypothetical protein